HGTLPPVTALLFSNATAPTEIYTLSLHDALPIYPRSGRRRRGRPRRLPRRPGRAPHHRHLPERVGRGAAGAHHPAAPRVPGAAADRKSTRLNSSHVKISYAVFCLKKKKKKTYTSQ